MAELLHGVVKWFNDAKGFGFIEHESGRDVFVHYSVVEQDGFKTLKDGEPVDYELREGDKGLNASRVVRSVQSIEKPEETANEASEGMTAPNLEAGTVNTIMKPASAMIEVENHPAEAADEQASAMPNAEATEDSEKSIS